MKSAERRFFVPAKTTFWYCKQQTCCYTVLSKPSTTETDMYLPSLTDAELVRHADNALDPLTSTELERELLKRLESRVATDTLPVMQLADEFEIDADGLRELLESHPGDLADKAAILAKLNDYDIHTLADLEQQIERSRKFYDIANDAGDALARLAALAAETL